MLSFSKREFYFNDDSRGHVRRQPERAVDLRHYFQMSATVVYYIPLHIEEHIIFYILYRYTLVLKCIYNWHPVNYFRERLFIVIFYLFSRAFFVMVVSGIARVANYV